MRVAFSHFNSDGATRFFMQWFGGSRGYSDDLASGLLRRHQHRYISPKAAAAWLRCMRRHSLPAVSRWNRKDRVKNTESAGREARIARAFALKEASSPTD